MNSTTNNNDDDDDTMFNSDMFVNRDYVKKKIVVNNIDINVYLLNSAATDYDLTGQVIWPAASMLTHYIVNDVDRYSNDNKVLEVGSGVGICGMFLARLGKQCVMSDYHDVVLELLEKNVQQSNDDGYPIEMLKLDWGNQEDIATLKQASTGGDGYDTIIGSDVVYWRTSIDPLFNTINQLLSHRDHAQFILCYQSRSTQTDEYLLEMAIKYGFAFEPLDPSAIIQSTTSSLGLQSYDEYQLSVMRFIVFKRSSNKQQQSS
ncbi:hypothetical protein SAMD00019534_048840, partial [Acytostelium subglobosum LB1]|uniref:hypothetical protein n=1 Tax=Acytostelium subglobosum LB1 TaxID=1410327 RepID=UPI00064514AE